MNDAWLPAVPSVAVAVALLVLPGLAVRLAGWNVRSITPYLLAPAISVAILAVAANVAPLVGLPWSPLPVIIMTVIAAAVAFGLRRWVGREQVSRPQPRVILAVSGGLVLAAVVIAVQLTYVFVEPDSISQTFDNIVHLNAVRLALDTRDASAFTVGMTSGIGFYPNGWHSIVTLVAHATGAGIPVAVNASNIAIGAVAWPASTMALSAVLFHERAAALVSAAALSTAFGAFPILLLHFGVLYPNMLAYAILPAGLAVVFGLLHETSRAGRVRSAVLLLVATAGIALAHPNALLALYAFGTVAAVWVIGGRAIARRDRRTWMLSAGAVAVLLLGMVVLWRVARTNAEMSQWGAWQSTAQAFGEAALISPRGFPLTIATAALLLIGLTAIVRRPRRFLLIGLPFLVAAVLFISASGVPAGTRLRDLLTNPWYNDPYRLAALLPVAGIPVAVLGVVVIVDLVARATRGRRLGVMVRTTVAAVSAVALFGVGAGENVTSTAQTARKNYVSNESAALLSSDERALIARLPETTPDDALLIANPWTGGSLAYALAGREVVERHVFGVRTEDEEYVDEHLDEIETDADVCAAIDRIGATYVLDFGDRNVFSNPDAGLERRGLNDLTASRHLVLVDSQGPDARLFRIEGC